MCYSRLGGWEELRSHIDPLGRASPRRHQHLATSSASEHPLGDYTWLLSDRTMYQTRQRCQMEEEGCCDSFQWLGLAV